MAQQQPPPTECLTAGKLIIGPTIAGARDGRSDNGNDINPEAGANTENRDNGGPAPRILQLPRGPPQPSDLLSEFLATLPSVNRTSAREFGHTGFIWPSVHQYIDLSSAPGGN